MQESKSAASVMVCSNYAWTIYNFRMPLIRRLRAEGFRVVVVSQFDGYEEKIRAEVDEVLPLFISRKGVNPVIDSMTMLHLLSYLLKCRPKFLLTFSVKPVIYGALAAKITGTPTIAMITGLGTAFISRGILTRVVMALYKIALSSIYVVFFQNSADKELFITQKLVNEEVCQQTPGSGVDTERFRKAPIPMRSEVSFLLIARMLRDKGIVEFVDAARSMKKKYMNVNFSLLGPLGVQNHTAIKEAEMRDWESEGVVQYLGETDDVAEYIADSTCVVLPSYREGTSRVLLEAAAMGRPIVAADVPGCREVVEHGVTGYLCQARDSSDLEVKLEAVINLTHKEICQMGVMARQKIVKEFRQEIVNDLYVNAIRAYPRSLNQ